MNVDDFEEVLVRALADHNPWWADGAAALEGDLPARQKSDFYHLVRPDEATTQFEEADVLGLVGRRGVGKTTLLRQFVHHEIRDGTAPERFCYVPLDADPLYQLHAADQVRRVVRYYRSRVLGRLADPDPHFVLLDDVHRAEFPHKPSVEGWGDAVRDVLADAPGRHVVVTASAEEQVRRELDRVDLAGATVDAQPVLPEKFRDYVFTRHPDLERGDTRVSPTPLRRGEGSLPDALATGDGEALAGTVRDQYDRVDGVARRLQSQVGHYLAMGGVLSYASEEPVDDATRLGEDAYERLREDLRTTLYRDAPGIETVQTVADLERLCALAARVRGADPVRYQRLVDLLEVDRRTVRDSYLSVLERLYVLTGVTEYDNQRPRALRLYLRDTGLVSALSELGPQSVLSDFDHEAALARVAAFDHSMRFAYGVNAAQGEEGSPTVQYWRGREGEVEFVLEVDGTPVPVGLAYRPPLDGALDPVEEFRSAYDAPLGLVLTGDTVSTDRPVELLADGVLALPYWLYLLLC